MNDLHAACELAKNKQEATLRNKFMQPYPDFHIVQSRTPEEC